MCIKLSMCSITLLNTGHRFYSLEVISHLETLVRERKGKKEGCLA